MRLSRERSCSVEIPGSTRWSSTKRRGPPARSRTISSVHLSPTRSRARGGVDRLLEGVRWRPTCADALHRGDPWADLGGTAARVAAERRARELRLPLVWPPHNPAPAQGAMRAAHYAAEAKRGGEFALA